MDLRMSTMSPKMFQQKQCLFCHRETEDRVRYGDLKYSDNIVAHYYCILMSTDLQQRGQDHQGIEGFLLDDIRKVLNNTKYIRCIYCNFSNATSRCAFPGCKLTYHYPCGLENHAVSQFCDSFKSYCRKHNLSKRRNTKRFLSLEQYPPTCIYCHDFISDGNYYVTECCRSCVMHIQCVKTHALTFGYFTRCPNCNSSTKFVHSIRCNGVFVPAADTLWELDNEANREFMLTLRCEASICKCRHGIGREHNAKNGFCKLCICRVCGGNAAHWKCKGTQGYTYLCSVCRPVLLGSTNCEQKSINNKVFDVKVMINPISLDNLRAMGIKIPCRYNLRSRSRITN